MEGKARGVTKADVAAAKALIVQRKEYPSTPRVRKELATLTQHSGNQNQVSEWLKELREEEKALTKSDVPTVPAEPLPHELQEVLEGGQAAVAASFAALAAKLAAVVAMTKAEIRRSADEQIAVAIAAAEKRADEAEIEAADRGAEIEGLDQEVDRLNTLLEQRAAELLSVREALAAARERISAIEVQRKAADKGHADALQKVEETAGALATLRERAAVLTIEREHALRQVTDLQAQLEAAMEKIGALAAELTDIKLVRAELAGQNRQLVSDMDHYRDTARQERERAVQAVEEAQAAHAELAKLTTRRAAAVEKTTTDAVPVA